MLLPKTGLSFLVRNKRDLTKDPLCPSLAGRHQANLDEYTMAVDGQCTLGLDDPKFQEPNQPARDSLSSD